LFRPDPRNHRHQHYCARAACRKASKAASQRRWLNKPENRDYFRGAANVQRVREWRATHCGDRRRYERPSGSVLQEHSLAQVCDAERKEEVLVSAALQEILAAQSVVVLGLIANLTGSVRQDQIVRTGQRLQQLGRDILTADLKAQGELDAQTPVDTRSAAPPPGAGP
jgi:hypothetical protein